MGGWNIPLAVQPAPQNPGPLDLYKQGIGVQDMINQQALQKQAQQQNQQALASNQIKLQQQQQDQQDQQALRSLAPKYANKDGNGTFDFEGLANEALTKTGNLNLVNSLRSQRYQMIEQASKAGSEQLANEQAHNKAAYEVIEGVKGVTDPAQRQTAYAQGMNKLKLLGVDTTKLPANAPNDDALESYESGLGMHGQLLADAKTHAETNEKNAEAAEKEWQKFPEMGTMINTRTGEQRTIQGGLVPPGQQEAKYLGIETKKNQGQALSPDEVAFAKSYEKMKTLVPVAQIGIQQSLLRPETQQALGQQFAQTGQLPTGLRSPAMSAQIMNNAAAQNPGGLNLAGNKAQYGADAGSLKSLQKQFDAVNAFENTAGKNLDVFLNEAKKITDTGLPVLNLPARMVAGKLGSEEQAAYNAARTTALTEIAKVLSSANAGSGVLSDSARHEVEGLIGGDATLAQTIRAANVLKQDMANRHDAYANQISDVQQRMKGSAAPSGGFQLPAGAKTATNPQNGHKIAAVDGKWVDAQTGKPI